MIMQGQSGAAVKLCSICSKYLFCLKSSIPINKENVRFLLKCKSLRQHYVMNVSMYDNEESYNVLGLESITDIL